MNAEDAVKMIRDAEADLSSEGFQEFLSALREVDPTQARQVERALDGLADEFFPRRIIVKLPDITGDQGQTPIAS